MFCAMSNMNSKAPFAFIFEQKEICIFLQGIFLGCIYHETFAIWGICMNARPQEYDKTGVLLCCVGWVCIYNIHILICN